MKPRSRSHDAEGLKVRHFFLHAKALSDLRRRPGTPSAVTDDELHELLESIWIAEAARAEPDADLFTLSRAYRLSQWSGMDNSADALEIAMSRATDFYEAVEVRGQALLI